MRILDVDQNLKVLSCILKWSERFKNTKVVEPGTSHHIEDEEEMAIGWINKSDPEKARESKCPQGFISFSKWRKMVSDNSVSFKHSLENQCFSVNFKNPRTINKTTTSMIT